MIYLQKCDIWDEVFERYKVSYSYTLDTLDFMPEKDVNYFCSFLRKNMLQDLKQSKKDAKRTVKKLRKADRKARRQAWWARVKARFKRNKPENPVVEELKDPEAQVSEDPTRPVVEEQHGDQTEIQSDQVPELINDVNMPAQ